MESAVHEEQADHEPLRELDIYLLQPAGKSPREAAPQQFAVKSGLMSFSNVNKTAKVIRKRIRSWVPTTLCRVLEDPRLSFPRDY